MRYYKQCFFIAVLFIALFPLNTFTQEKIVLTDTNTSLQIGKSVYYIKDEKNQVTFNDILKHKYDSLYKKIDTDIPNFGNVQLTIWNKFTVVNHSSGSWYLVVDNFSLDTLNFYYPDSAGKYHGIYSGRSVPLSANKYKTSTYVFDITVPKNDSAAFYLKVQTYFMQYPLLLMTREAFISTYHKTDMLAGFYFGFLLFIVLYNLFVYFSVKDKAYLYYIIYVISVGLMVAQLKGYIAELWGTRFHFMWPYAPVIIAISSLTNFFFIKHILETRKNVPVLDKIINFGFIPVYFLIILLSCFNYNLAASILNQVIGIIALVFLYSTAITIYRKGFKFARFYIIACWFYFAGVLIYVLKAFTLLPFTGFTNSSIEIGSTIEMIMFSFMIADKINIYKKERARARKDLLQSLQENEKLITEQNKMLEIKVKERTSELRETLGQLELSQQELKHKNIIITKEKERSDNLLLNILPYETAQELKEKGKAEAKLYNDVTVMFTDFKDFTNITERMQPAELVAELDECFKAFDRIVEQYDVEKIKTIGDSYMAASGIPVPDKMSAQNIILAALDIQAFMQHHNLERTSKEKLAFEIRIGIHTGPVIAGIVGTKKFAYDIWGDTVNTASRMESSGQVGKINISGSTYSLVKHRFKCSHRGKIVAKNKGIVDMYFVEKFLG